MLPRPGGDFIYPVYGRSTVDIFRMSLFSWGGYTPDKDFVGIDNFKTLFQSDRFYQAFQNSILLIVVVTIVTFAMALIFAYILTRERIRGRGFFRVIFYIPNILSVVVISAIFSAIYDPNQGLLNSFLNLFRGADDPILWLGNQRIVIYSIAIAMVWQAIGYYMVMYMASMANIPESLYESASLEGAGKITQFFTITIPLIWANIRTTPDLLCHQQYQYEFPDGKSYDKWRAGWRIQCVFKLYVSGGIYEFVLWLRHGYRRYGIFVFICAGGNPQCCDQAA